MCISFVFLIANLLLHLSTNKRIYFYFRIGLIGLYLVYLIYLANQQGISLLCIIHHILVLTALAIPYLYVDGDHEKGNRDDRLNKVMIGFGLLIVFTTPSA